MCLQDLYGVRSGGLSSRGIVTDVVCPVHLPEQAAPDGIDSDEDDGITVTDITTMFPPELRGLGHSDNNNCHIDNNRKWLWFDGPVNPGWTEALHSAMDTTGEICLPNGSRVNVDDMLSVLMEVDDLKTASPVTVARCSIVYYSDVVTWKDAMAAWIDALPMEWRSGSGDTMHWMTVLHDVVDRGLDYLSGRAGVVLHTGLHPSPLSVVTSFTRVFTSLTCTQLDSVALGEDVYNDTLKALTIISFVWSFGGHLIDRDRPQFDGFVRSLVKELTPMWSSIPVSRTVYDIMFDFDVVDLHIWTLQDINDLLLPFQPTEDNTVPVSTMQAAAEAAAKQVASDSSNRPKRKQTKKSNTDNQQTDGEVSDGRSSRRPTVALTGSDDSSDSDEELLTDHMISDGYRRVGSTDGWRRVLGIAGLRRLCGDAVDSSYGGDTPGAVLFVPTVDRMCHQQLLQELFDMRYPVCVTGEASSGKTALIGELLREHENNVASRHLQLSPHVDAQSVRRSIEDAVARKSAMLRDMKAGRMRCRTRSRAVNSPNSSVASTPTGPQQTPGRRAFVDSVCVFVDDVHLAATDVSSGSPCQELMRQVIDHSGYHNGQQWRDLSSDNVWFTAAAHPHDATTKSFDRFTRHFLPMFLPMMPEESMQSVCSVSLQQFSSGPFFCLPNELSNAISRSSVGFTEIVRREARPTPAHPHYVYGLRDALRLCQSVLLLRPQDFPACSSRSLLAYLWVHESVRVLLDRVVNSDTKQHLVNVSMEMAKRHFGLEDAVDDWIYDSDEVEFDDGQTQHFSLPKLSAQMASKRSDRRSSHTGYSEGFKSAGAQRQGLDRILFEGGNVMFGYIPPADSHVKALMYRVQHPNVVRVFDAWSRHLQEKKRREFLLRRVLCMVGAPLRYRTLTRWKLYCKLRKHKQLVSNARRDSTMTTPAAVAVDDNGVVVHQSVGCIPYKRQAFTASSVRTLQFHMMSYNTDTSNIHKLNLVFFRDAVAHILRIVRVLRFGSPTSPGCSGQLDSGIRSQSGPIDVVESVAAVAAAAMNAASEVRHGAAVATDNTHMLLLGAVGSGRRSLTRFSSYISGFQCIESELTPATTQNEFRSSLRTAHDKAGLECENVVLLITGLRHARDRNHKYTQQQQQQQQQQHQQQQQQQQQQQRKKLSLFLTSAFSLNHPCG